MSSAHIAYVAESNLLVGFAGTTAAIKPVNIFSKSGFKISIYNDGSAKTCVPAENCSWGYEMISFEIKSPADKKYTVTRKPKPWDKNYPIPVAIGAKDISVREIHLLDGTWQGLPAGISGSQDGWIIRVNLMVEKDILQLSKEPFWAGKISSRWKPAELVSQ